LDVDQISNVLPINRRTFFRYRDEFILKVKNPASIKKQTWGGRRNSLMTEEEELEFLSQFINNAEKGFFVSVVPNIMR
jgi:hypothetical protein